MHVGVMMNRFEMLHKVSFFGVFHLFLLFLVQFVISAGTSVDEFDEE
jgi:hypothetical protein